MKAGSDRGGGRYNTLSVTVSNEELARLTPWLDEQAKVGVPRTGALRQLIFMGLRQIEDGEVPDALRSPVDAAEAQMGATLGLSFLIGTLLSTLVRSGAISGEAMKMLRKGTLTSLEHAKAADEGRNAMLWEEAARRVKDLTAQARTK